MTRRFDVTNILSILMTVRRAFVVIFFYI